VLLCNAFFIFLSHFHIINIDLVVLQILLNCAYFKCLIRITCVQDASRENSQHAYAKFVESAWESSRHCTLRGQMELVKLSTPINIDEVEPAANIVKRFCTGNLKLGSSITFSEGIRIVITGFA